MSSKNPWLPIGTAPSAVPVWEPIDLWLEIKASPMSMGMGDSFRVVDCWKRGDDWFHHSDIGVEKQLRRECVTHWMRPPQQPQAGRGK